MNKRWDSPITESKDIILSLAFVTFYVNSAVRFFIPAVMPLIIISLHVSLAYAAVLVTSYWVGYTIMQIPSGIINDKFTSSRVNKVSFLAMSAVFTLFYFYMGNFTALLLIQFSLGILSALVYISDVSLIQTWFTHRQRTISVGIYQTAFFLGASLGEYITITLASVSVNLPILVISIFLFALGFVNLVFIKDPEHVQRRVRKRIKVSISSGIAYVSLIRFSASFVYLGFLSLFTTYLVTSGKISYAGSANYSWLAAVAGLVGSPLGGILTDRYAKTKLYPALISNVLIAFLVILIAFVTNITIIVPLALMMGFLYGIYASPSMSLATELSKSDEEIGSASGFLNFSAQIGGSVSPLIIGFLAEATGNYSLSFVIIGVISLIFLSPLAMLIRSKKEGTIYVRTAEE